MMGTMLATLATVYSKPIKLVNGRYVSSSVADVGTNQGNK